MSNGQGDELGVCCHCHPYPQCGHWCEVTDIDDCLYAGGTWIGPQQNNGCDHCEDVCTNCEGGCTNDDECPDGWVCVGGQCVSDTTNPEACNRDGQPNCKSVVHVRRPYYSDGTPAFSEWGVAIWHPPCDEDCDGDTSDEVADDDGVITFELKQDIYDEDGNPIGIYGNGCCCPLYLIVAVCGSGPKCINLEDVCPGQIPEWNAKEGEVLILRGKEGTEAEGFCAYSIYNFNEDGSQKYDACENPVYEWVLNNTCRYGVSDLDASPPCSVEAVGSANVRFCNLDVEVFQVPDPEWVYGERQRLCAYACDKCWAIYSQCGNCDSYFCNYPAGKCIGSHLCEFEEGGDNDHNFHKTPDYDFHCESPCRQDLPFDDDCMQRSEIITNEQYALNDFYWDMPHCAGSDDPNNPQYKPEPCDECTWLLLSNCTCTNCHEHLPELECPQYVYTVTHHQHWNIRDVLKVYIQFDHTSSDICGCYNVIGIVEERQIPEGAYFTTVINSEACYPHPDGGSECHPTDICRSQSEPCCQGSPSCSNLDCVSWCPPWACNEEYGTPGPAGECLRCCDCEDLACTSSPNDCPCNSFPWGGDTNVEPVRPDTPITPHRPLDPEDEDDDWITLGDRSLPPPPLPVPNFDALELYPNKIDVLLPIELPTIKTEVPVSFIADSPLPMVVNPTPVQIDSYNAMRPYKYVPSFVTQELGKTIRTGSFADSRVGIPQVNEANYLGDYTDGSEEWSAWLAFTDCSGVNSETNGTRHFSFTYTIFAYCQSGDCKQESKVIERKTVEFYIDARIDGRL